MEEYKIYKEKQSERIKAEEWLALSKARDSQSSRLFMLSLAHSNVMLMRCGQHYAGGQNYWESPKPLNAAILKAIEKNYDLIVSDALGYLIEAEKEALIKCEELNKKLRYEIDKVKAELEAQQ